MMSLRFALGRSFVPRSLLYANLKVCYSFASPRFFASKTSTKNDLSKIRNIGIIAHVDAGKTTTCERMLFYTGLTHRVGDVDAGDTVMDYLDMERERGITINAAAITMPWRKHTINLIDTPGHVDFTVEVERAVRVLDGAVTILDAVSGVQAQTETVWRQADRYGVARVVYVNKMDREGASLNSSVASIRERLYVEPFVIHHPIGSYKNFRAVVDLVAMELLEWSEDHFGFEMTRTSLAGTEYEDNAKKLREKLCEQVANFDEETMDKLLGGEVLSTEDLLGALRRVTIARKGVVVLVGSSLKNKGVHPVLDSIIDFLPSPLEVPPLAAEDEKGKAVTVAPDASAELTALAFKVIHDAKKGMLVYFRVYSGVLNAGDKLLNTRTGEFVRVMKLVKVAADDLEDIKEVTAGNIGAALGLKDTRTGDTLVAATGRKIKFKGLHVPEPVYSCSVLPESSVNEEELTFALNNLQLEDPRSTVENETDYRFSDSFTAANGRTEEIQIGLSLSRNSEPKNDFRISKDFDIQRLSNNKKVVNDLTEALRQGAEDAFSTGYPSGFPFHDVVIEVTGLSFENGAPTSLYRVAMVKAVMEAAKEAGCVVLEPVMELKLQVDSAHLRAVMSDLTSRRRGSVQKLSQEKHLKYIDAQAPLKELQGYSTDMRSFTKGTGFFSMEFLDYLPPTPQIQKQILKEHGYFDV